MTEPKDYTKPKKEEDTPVETKVIRKVVTGDVVTRKKGLGRRFKEVFFGGDLRSAGYYVAAEVLLPAMRNMIVESGNRALEKIIYGDSGVSRRRAPDLRGRVTYNSPVRTFGRDPRERTVMFPDQPPFPPPLSLRSGPRRNSEIIMSKKEDAEMTLEQMVDILDRYENCSIADLNEMMGQPSSHTDYKWGWFAPLGHVEIRQVSEGFLLELPDPQPIT